MIKKFLYSSCSQSRGGNIRVWDYSHNEITSCVISDPGFCKLATFDESKCVSRLLYH